MFRPENQIGAKQCCDRGGHCCNVHDDDDCYDDDGYSMILDYESHRLNIHNVLISI